MTAALPHFKGRQWKRKWVCAKLKQGLTSRKKKGYTVLGFLHSTALCPENIPDNKIPKNIGYNIERIISIEDNFYTISPNMIKVTNIETMEGIKEGTCEFGDK